MSPAPPRILIIAGSDSGGGAGIQVDIKTITMLGGYAMTAITATTAQNTLGVSDIHPIPPEHLRKQIDAVCSDIGIDAVKIGMLHDAQTIATVKEALETYAADVPVILDPVMVATSGSQLLDETATQLLVSLFPLSRVITPNIPEAEALTGLSVTTQEDMEQAVKALSDMGAATIVLKGGHSEGHEVYDLLYDGGEMYWFGHRRIDTPHTHGTGCTLASALAICLAKGDSLEVATEKARAYVLEAIRTAPGFGQGHGPLNHMHLL